MLSRFHAVPLLATLLLPALAVAGPKPLWELGLGAGAISFPDYPGSDQQHYYAVPVPYVVYRGEILRAGRHGLEARLFGTDRVRGYLSLSASPPVNSSDNAARVGMPSLKPMVEFGPAVEVHLWRAPSRRIRLDLRVPVRTVYTVQNQPRHVGWLLAPVLNLDLNDIAAAPGWNFGAQAGPLFADRTYNETFYEVAPAYATAARPTYAASGGYAGSQLTLALSKRFPRYWVGAFARYTDLHGAVFAASPLVRREHNLSFGVGFAWILGQSTHMVDRHE